MADDANTPQFTFRTSELRSRDLLVVQVDGRESISRQFHYRLLLASKLDDIETEKVVGKAAVLTVLMNRTEPGGGRPDDTDVARYVNGIVSRFEHVRGGSTFSEYELELVPYVWMLNHRKKSRIFQQKTTPDIIKQVLEEGGLTSEMFRIPVSGTYKPRDFCVQYRESDWDFISRLMEEEGIFYFFEHNEESHVLVIGDAPEVNLPIVGTPELPLRPPSGMVDLEHVVEFRFGQQIRPGAVVLRDFEFTKPVPAVEAKVKAQENVELEIYDYPGEYAIREGDKNKRTAEEATRLGNVRLQEYQSTRLLGRGKSNSRRMIVGSKFTLTDSPRDSDNQPYLLTSLHMVGSQPQSVQADFAGDGTETPPKLLNDFVCIPFSVPFRPQRVTPKPVIHGSQTGIVTGPSSEEIYTDEHGRVKVHFHWDREGVFDENDSCWIRVSHSWAGGQYGSIHIPRIGQEVIVDFLEGDPDQPIITGRIYNGDHKPPYKLPDEKTKSTLRTNSSTGGCGANELRFEDKKGKEQVFLHAEKDLHIRVKGSEAVAIGGMASQSIWDEYRQYVKKHHSLKIDGMQAIKIKETMSYDVGGDVHEKFALNHGEECGINYYLKAGVAAVIEAGAQLTLKVGGNFIDINPAGVFIKGTMVFINSGGSPGSGTAPAPTAPADPAAPDTEKPGMDVDYTGKKEPPVTPTPPVLPEKSWIKLVVKTDDGKPVPGERYKIITSDGEEIEGSLDVEGKIHLGGLEPGQVQIFFPGRDETEIQRG